MKKRLLSLLTVLTMLVTLLPIGGVFAAGEPPAEKIPLTADMVSSSGTSYGNMTYVVDGNADTYWRGKGQTSTLSLDLKGVYVVDHFVFKVPARWPSRTQTCTVSGKLDGEEYSLLLEDEQNLLFEQGQNTVTITLPERRSVRYLQLAFSNNTGDANGPQIGEWEVYGYADPDADPVIGKIDLTHANTAASSDSYGGGAAAAFDGSQGTYWNSISHGAGATFSELLVLDMRRIHVVDHFVFKVPSHWDARTQTVTITGSLNGVEYDIPIAENVQLVFDPVSGNTVELMLDSQVSVQYLRLEVTASTNEEGRGQIGEWEVYGYADPAAALPERTTIVCVGDSITYGDKCSNRIENAYPAHLWQMLGDEYEVFNRGRNGCTMGEHDRRYIYREDQIQNTSHRKTLPVTQSDIEIADMVIIMLGDNDANLYWQIGDEDAKENYLSCYTEMITQFQEWNPDLHFVLATPPTGCSANGAGGLNVKIRDISEVLRQYYADNYAQDERFTLADINTMTAGWDGGHDDWYADNVHFNDEGYKQLASLFYDVLFSRVDRTELEALIASVTESAGDSGKYTAGSVAALTTAVEHAQGVVDDADATQETVDAEVTALKAAIDALVDISGLKTLLDGQKSEEQLSGYTQASVEAYNKLFTDAKAVYDNPNATKEDVAAQVTALQNAESVLKEETPEPDDNVVDVTTGEAVSVEGHMLDVNQTLENPIDLSDYANREVSLQFQIKLDKTENFAETLNAFVDGDNWMSYIRNGRVRVNGSEIGTLQATVGLLAGMTEGEYVTVTVQIPQAIVEQGTLTGYEMYMYNDLHRFGEDMDPEAETNDGTYTEANEGSKGVTMTVKDVKLVIGDELPAQDPNAKMVWSTIVGDYNTLQNGTQVYIDWKSADGYPLDTEEGPGADLSGTAANGANKNYNLQIKFTFKDVNLPENVTIDQMVKVLFVRLRSSRIDDAEKAAKGLEFTLKAEGDGERLVLEPDADGVYSINVPLSMMVTENIDWTDVKQMIIRMEIADEYTGTANMTNPYFTLSVQEAKIVDTDPENPDVPVEPTVDKTKLEALIETAKAEAAKTDMYTEDSIAALEDAIDAAQAVVDDAEATQEDVDAQLTALQAAIDELEEITVTPEPELGDVNGDGQITAMDALLALQAATGKLNLTDEQKAAANVNGDEAVTAEDALVLLQYATQKISELPHVEPVEEPAE